MKKFFFLFVVFLFTTTFSLFPQSNGLGSVIINGNPPFEVMYDIGETWVEFPLETTNGTFNNISTYNFEPFFLFNNGLKYYAPTYTRPSDDGKKIKMVWDFKGVDSALLNETIFVGINYTVNGVSYLILTYIVFPTPPDDGYDYSPR